MNSDNLSGRFPETDRAFDTPPTLLRVCSFESRRNSEMAMLIEKTGGIAITAPSLREVPVEDNTQVFEFAKRLLSDRLDLIILLTGVGTEALFEVLASRNLRETVLEKLQTTPIAIRGPKPLAVLTKLGLKAKYRAPAPNRWQDLGDELDRHGVQLNGIRLAVQEYGESSEDFYEWLRSRGADVFAVPVYKWAFPIDTAPMEAAIRETIAGQIDILLWTSAQQINHVFQTAEQLGLRDEWLHAARRCVVGSIGPTATGRLRDFTLPPDVEPTHTKMAHLIRESLEAAPALLAQKRMQQP